MKIIGLTGGIATGKSTAAQVLERDGVHVIDADQLAREVTAVGTPGFHDVVCAFGRAFLTDDGQLDRRRLGNFVYANADRRHALEAIVVPRVNQLALQRFERLKATGLPAVLYETALLFETDWQKYVDSSIVLTVPVEVQRERLMRRDNLSRTEADRRIGTQMASDKRKRGTIVIENTGTVDELTTKVRTAWGRLVGGLA